MKIAIDVRCLIEGRRTGVEEYTLNLLKNLFEIDKANNYVLFLNSFRPDKAELKWVKKYPNVSLKKFRFPNKLLNFCFWYFDFPKIDKMIGGADIVFLPNIIFASVSAKTKLIATIHDLSFERFPETFSRKRRLWHGFINPKKICRRARKIIAVSDSTKNDLQSLYGIKPEKIEIIPSGVSGKFLPISRNNQKLIEVKERYGLPYKFILFLGTLEPRKNIAALIRAFDSFKEYAAEKNNENLIRFKLVIAGQSGWLGEKIYCEIEKAKHKKDILVVNFIPEEDKPFVMNLATLFVYPSIFEGFGFPPLEAMKCGVPVITSNNSSLPEVIGSGGIMVNFDKPDEIEKAMRQILENPQLYEKMKEAGLKKAGEFSWKNTARKFLDIIKNLA
ncbi:MAG: glycosyltransferase family 1 protein [Parcubacteria group bacterium]